MRLTHEQAKKILAQRFPMLMVDRVTGFEPGRSITVVKAISGNDIFLLGHFPSQAVWPGVLIIETMAQASTILFDLTQYGEALEGKTGVNVLHRTNLTFLHPVFPGDLLAVRMDVVKLVERGLVVKGTASVDGRVVARGELVLGEAPVQESATHSAPAVAEA